MFRRRAWAAHTAPTATSCADVDDAVREISERTGAGRRADALALTRAALARAPDNPELIALRGSLLLEWGRIREARDVLAAAIAAGVDRPALLLQLGWAALWSGDAVAAEAAMRRAVGSEPANWGAHFGLGAALQGQRRYDEAIAAHERSLDCSPEDPNSLREIAACHVEAGRLGEALRTAQRLCDKYPEDISALATYAAVLVRNDRFADAISAYERIARLDVDRTDANRMPLEAGIALREDGRANASMAFYEQHLPERPSPNGHVNYAFALLKTGHLIDGFDHYEFRWMIDPLLALRPRFNRPAWTGQPLDGKTILVLDEQGFGDIIQFLRYVPLLKARGARVLLLLRRPIAELIQARSGVDEIVFPAAPLPHFDFHVHLMGLPGALRTDVHSIPCGVPYLFAEPERVARWRSRIQVDGSLNVGLVWAGDPKGLGRGQQKSTTLASLSSWGQLPGVRFYSLQKGDAAAEAANPPEGLSIANLSPDICHFADTAAIIESLDLVISVCTSVAHLSGAMGKPTWTMLAEPADWRWMEHRDDTPWYPTMRLFRQPRQGDWWGVVARIGDELKMASINRDVLKVPPNRIHPSDAVAASETASFASRRHPIAGLCVAVEARHGIFELRREGIASERSIKCYGEDLEGQLELLHGVVAAGATVLEVGSGIGAHAVPLAVHLGETGHLLLTEPRPELAPILHNNLAANGVRGITVLRTDLLGEASSATDDDGRATIDRLDLRRLDWLKVGEGMDVDAILRGASDTLWSLRPRVFAAVAREGDLARVAGLLRDFGYHCWRADTPRFRAANFNRRDDDVFDGAVVHAVLAVPEESVANPPLAGLAPLNLQHASSQGPRA
jgi:tetratricopeptide (TPR) repeat protein